jgi:phosphoglycolate phosphatase-like HAD superfamily hydrolase
MELIKVSQQEQLSLINLGVGRLFPRILHTLEYLKNKGAKLYIALNGGKPYLTAVVEATKMGKYFEGINTAGE